MQLMLFQNDPFGQYCEHFRTQVIILYVHHIFTENLLAPFCVIGNGTKREPAPSHSSIGKISNWEEEKVYR